MHFVSLPIMVVASRKEVMGDEKEDMVIWNERDKVEMGRIIPAYILACTLFSI